MRIWGPKITLGFGDPPGGLLGLSRELKVTAMTSTGCKAKSPEGKGRWGQVQGTPASESPHPVGSLRERLIPPKQTGYKLGQEYVKDVYCHPAYLTYMQSTSWETLGWKKQKMESRLPGEISVTLDIMEESEEELKSLLMRVKEESEKVG